MASSQDTISIPAECGAVLDVELSAGSVDAPASANLEQEATPVDDDVAKHYGYQLSSLAFIKCGGEDG